MANSGTPWLLILVVVLGYFVLSDTSPFKTGGSAGTAGSGGTGSGDISINITGCDENLAWLRVCGQLAIRLSPGGRDHPTGGDPRSLPPPRYDMDRP